MQCGKVIPKARPRSRYCTTKCNERAYCFANREKRRARMRVYGAEHRERKRAYDAVRQVQFKKQLSRLKASGCVTCGKTYPPRMRPLLDFDHSPDLVKRFGKK